ncbi:hypothetical protein QFZ42_004442 [Variovorax paradoxus]|nr:hypothetical protein [Variovorax paradoxus]
MPDSSPPAVAPVRLDDVAALPAAIAFRLKAVDSAFLEHDFIELVADDPRVRPLADELEVHLRQSPVLGLLRERNEDSVSAAWTQRSQDDVETSGAKSLCGYEGGNVPSPSAMFGMPNTIVVFERLIHGNAPEPRNCEVSSTLEFRGPQSLCGYERGIVPSTSAMFGMPNIDGGLRTADRPQRSGAAKRRGELYAGIPRAKSLCGHEGRID